MDQRVFLIFLTTLLALFFVPAAAEITLPAGLLAVGEEAFAGDMAIQRVIVPEGTEEIGPGAFAGCANLEEVILPASLKRVDQTAFDGCGRLRAVYAQSYTPACQWALERGLTVLETGTGLPLTPYTHDMELSDEEAAETAVQIVLVKYLGGSRAALSVHEKRLGMWARLWETAAAVGSGGIGKTREGDMRTPAGAFHLTAPFGILPDPGARMPYLQVAERHYWCGTSGDPLYNQLVDEEESGRPRASGDEHLIRYRPQYNYCMFIDYNAGGEPGKGSCIFLHCTGGGSSTAGCVAVSQDRMIDILRWALPGVMIVIRQS